MEFVPSSSDVSSPKGVIIVNSLAFVVLTAIGMRWWFKRGHLQTPPKAAGPPTKAQGFGMAAKDFGDTEETRRDASRSYAGGAIYLLVDIFGAEKEANLLKLIPPSSTTTGVDKESVNANLKALAADLRSRLPELEVTDALVERLLPMLTVNPAISALSAAGQIPMLKDNRFVLRVSGEQREAGKDAGSRNLALHAFTVGYVGTLPTGPGGKASAADEVLTVTSPNLLLPSPGDANKYNLAFALRRAEKKSLEEELLVPGVLEVPLEA